MKFHSLRIYFTYLFFPAISFVESNNVDNLFENQPRILVQDGHIILESAKHKNITLRSTGFVNVAQGNSLLQIGVHQFKDTNQKIHELSNRISYLENVINEEFKNQFNLLEKKLHQIMDQMEDNSSATPSDVIVTLQQKVKQLNRQYTTISSTLLQNMCSSNPCRNGGTCIGTYGSHVCHCPENWTGDNCENDVNECFRFVGTDLGCQNGATCRNLPGTYECHCSPNWYGIHCTKRTNDCESGGNSEICGHGTCVSQTSGNKNLLCLCDQGWSKDSLTQACTVDINECESFSPPCSRNPRVACTNTLGSFTCSPCPSGYHGNGYYCDDINECLVNNGGCSTNPLVRCSNTPGSSTCEECPSGYQGDGKSCIYMGPCHLNNGGCSPMAVCVAISSIVQCFCRPGFNGLGVGPYGCSPGNGINSGPMSPGDGSVVISPCAIGPCKNGATCLPMANSFICNCLPGYRGINCDSEINECESNPCYNGASCIDKFNGYQCLCSEGFEGVTCSEEVQICGGIYRTESGSLVFPPGSGTFYDHELSCEYKIISPNASKVLNITFTQFQLETSPNCIFDWLQISNNIERSSSSFIGRYCGNTLPNGGNIVSDHHSVNLWFYSDHSINNEGFSLTWSSIDPICGGLIENLSHGVITSPGYPGHYPSNRNCTWTIIADFSKRIQFHFAMISLETHSNCSADYLQIRDGSEDFSDTNSVLQKFCSSVTPPPLTSSGSVVSIDFHSDNSLNDAGFHITWALVNGITGCGGLFTEDQGEVSSPSHPQTYASLLRCDYIIRTSLGQRISLSFVSFDVEESDNCRYDFVEVRDGHDDNSPLLARICGSSLPSDTHSSGHELYIKFVTDHSISHTGFRARYNTICRSEYSSPNGIIQSPSHPNAYPHNKICHYIISQPPGTSIHLEFIDFDIEDSYDCLFDYIEIRDGDNENSTLIGRFCGDSSLIPMPIDSSHNYLWIRFVTDGSVNNRGFKLQFYTREILCGGILKANHGIIQSPTHPENYPHGVDCLWIITGQPGTVVRVNWMTFVLEGFGYFDNDICNADYVSVYDNSTDSSENSLMGKFCGQNLPPVLTSLGHQITIMFHSDESVSYDGFSASYIILEGAVVCGGNYYTTTGVIRSPGWPQNYRANECHWKIEVPMGQQILLNITTFDLEPENNCRYDYLEIRNGGYLTSPLIGRYCGNTIPRTIPSFSNQLSLTFKSDSSHHRRGFEIYWDGTSSGCGGLLTSSTGSIISPGYPQAYSHNSECEWNIHVNKGSKIQLFFIDLHLTSMNTCLFDYVQVLDSNGKEIGKYCQGNSEPLKSSGNSLKIRFNSNIRISVRGFHLTYRTDCNVMLTEPYGIIESINYPNLYSSNQNCTWTISAPLGNKINMTFTNFETNSINLLSSRDCETHFIQIYEKQRDSHEQKNISRFCTEETKPNVVITSTMENLYIHFLTNTRVANMAFQIEYVIFGCGESFVGKSSGVISSPNYPNLYPVNIECVWSISSDLGSSIELTIMDLYMESSANCNYDSLHVYGGPEISSPLLTSLCHRQNKPIVVSSQGNNMLLVFKSDAIVNGRGFKAIFNTKHEGCGGLFTSSRGYIMSPNYPKAYNNHDDCLWLLETDVNHAIEFKFEDFDVEPHTNCSYDYVALYDGEIVDESNLIVHHCGQDVPSPSTFISSGNKLTVRLKADGSLSSKGFKASYKRTCGAHIVTEGNGELTSPNYPHGEIDAYSCKWVIEGRSENDRITILFHHIDIMNWYESDNCTNVNLQIIDGNTVEAPLIGHYCGQSLPPSLTTQGNSMVVLLNSTFYNKGIGFRATYTVANSACGGELKSLKGQFTSPHYPNNYPPDVECVWNLGGWPGNKILLTFILFDVEESEHCNKDYLEIHKNGPEGELLAHLCGSNLPRSLVVSDTIWIKFRSDDSITNNGFHIEFSCLSNNEILGENNGEISSPMYPLSLYSSNEDLVYTWRISVSSQRKIEIEFTDFEVSEQDSYCTAKFKIHDGYDDSALVLLEACGYSLPQNLQSTGNVLFISLAPDPYMSQGSLFKLRWREVDYESDDSSLTSTITSSRGTNECFHYIFLNSSLFLQNNNYPVYNNSENCTWILQSTPFSRIEITFLKLRMESSWSCMYDHLSIFDGEEGRESWRLLSRYCRRDQENSVIISSGSFLKMTFIADSSIVQGEGFRVKITPVCGGYTLEKQGVIQSPGFPSKYPVSLNCVWVVHVRPGRTISLAFTHLDIESSSSVQCLHDYLLLRNGKSSISPLLLLNEEQGNHQNGRLCGSLIPKEFNTSSNYLYIQFVSGLNLLHQNTGFRLTYNEISLNCGETLLLDEISFPNTFISSPNYPNVPLPHSECIWIIQTAPGRRIQMDFNDGFDIRPSIKCEKSGLELRNGASSHSPLLSNFCSQRPSSQFSRDNVLFVRYYTHQSNPNNGFKARVSIAKCGGSFYLSRNTHNSYLTISSPNYPETYDSSLNCEWHLMAPQGHYISFHFLVLNLPRSSNCSHSDNITILENEPMQTKNVFCGQVDKNLTPHFDTVGNNATVIFKSDKNDNGRKWGFILKANISIQECGEDVEGTSGVLETIGYPNGIGHAWHCVWNILAPLGHRISIEFLDFDIPYDCSRFLVLGYSKIDESGIHYLFGEEGSYRSGGYKALCGNSSVLGKTFISVSNTVYIGAVFDAVTSHRGIKIRWSSIESPSLCGGIIRESHGVLRPLMNTTSGTYIIPQVCMWKVINSGFNSTIAFHSEAVKTFHFSDEAEFCSPDYLTLNAGILGNPLDQTLLVCNSRAVEYINPYSVTSINFVVDNDRPRPLTSSQEGFNLTFTRHNCGGVLSSQSHIIQSPHFPQNYSQNADCCWKFDFDDGEQIQIDVTFMDIPSSSSSSIASSSCESDYLEILSGHYLHSLVSIWKGCGSVAPPSILSMDNSLSLHFHSNDDPIKGKGFSLRVTPLRNGCGGVLHGSQGNISSPNVNGSYPNGLECIWEIQGISGFHIEVDFYHRFEIEVSSNCKNDYIQLFVYNKDNKSYHPYNEKYCGRQLPNKIITNSQNIQIKFVSNAYITGDGFHIFWKLGCGGSFADNFGEISSPGYPNAYQNNIFCNYTILTSNDDYIELNTQEPFGIEKSSGCIMDSLTIKNGDNQTLGVYCNERPNPLIIKGSISLLFQTDGGVVDKGFKIKYRKQECGGKIINDDLEIKSPTYLDQYLHSSNCTWHIIAPMGQVVQIKFDYIEMENSQRCQYDYVALYHGYALNERNSIGRFCGNQTKEIPIIKSRNNEMTLQFKSDGSISSRGFKAQITFTYGEESGCGGIIDLRSDDSPKSFRSLDANADGKYEIDIICEWSVIAPANKIIKISFSSFNVENEQNLTYKHCWDFLEVRDGPSVFSPLIDKLCGNLIPTPILRTSSNFAWLRFVSDSSHVETGFVGTISSESSVCGSHTILNVTKETQVLFSPQFPNNYPPNLRCRWTLAAPSRESDKIHVKFLDLNIPFFKGCTRDHVTLTDIVNRPRDQSFNSSINMQSYSSDTIFTRWRQNIFHQELKFCGNELPHEFYSLNDVIQLDFVSDSNVESERGFKLEYSIASCNRSYDETNGRILSPRYPSRTRIGTNCLFIIQTLSSSTISIYFNFFSVYQTTNCSGDFLEIYDGDSLTAPLLSRDCGHHLPSSVHSSGNILTLYFRSELYSAAGYDLSYTTTSRGRGCGGNLSNIRGVLTSPSFPRNYYHELDCTWSLSVPLERHIELKLTIWSFGTSENCNDNYLEVYDVISPTERTLVSKFCGNDNPANHIGASNSIELHFVKAASTTGGWRAQFEMALLDS